MIYLAKSYQNLPRLSDVYEKNNKHTIFFTYDIFILFY